MIIASKSSLVDRTFGSLRSSAARRSKMECWARSEALAISWNDGFKETSIQTTYDFIKKYRDYNKL